MLGVVLVDPCEVDLQSCVLPERFEVGELGEPGDEDEDGDCCVDEHGSVERAYLIGWGRDHRRQCMRRKVVKSRATRRCLGRNPGGEICRRTHGVPSESVSTSTSKKA